MLDDPRLWHLNQHSVTGADTGATLYTDREWAWKSPLRWRGRHVWIVAGIYNPGPSVTRPWIDVPARRRDQITICIGWLSKAAYLSIAVRTDDPDGDDEHCFDCCPDC